jgi:hypothetical protein
VTAEVIGADAEPLGSLGRADGELAVRLRLRRLRASGLRKSLGYPPGDRVDEPIGNGEKPVTSAASV